MVVYEPLKKRSDWKPISSSLPGLRVALLLRACNYDVIPGDS
jgi:hypothetical protein